MLNTTILLERLDKVRKTQQGWTACCPVHGDRNPSMSIAVRDSLILCHCHACGANGLEVVAAVGLKPDVLFDKPFEREEDKHWMLNKKADWDEYIIALTHETLQRGDTMSYKDYQAARESLARREQRRKLNLPIMFNMDIQL